MDNIPLFPLNIVAVPKERIPLHIFEPRYKQMIKDSIKTGDPFGIVLKDDKGVKSIGCSVKIIRVLKEHPTGEYDIIVQGLQCFRIKEKTQENNQLWIGKVTYLEDNESASADLLDKTRDQYLHILLKLGLNEDMERHMSKSRSFDFIEFINLPNKIKQQLIETNDENQRLEIINRIFTGVMTMVSFGTNGQQISEA
ncbi:MAG: LON peptidase substrate-binding domain-containing protein [Candidatus Neomarinimicrobiota bacterium]